jgi:outer membrane protein
MSVLDPCRACRGAALALALLLPAPALAADPPPRSLGLLQSIELMLAHDPNIALGEARLESSRGALLSERGRFDPVLSSRVNDAQTRTPLGPGSSSRQELLESSVDVAKQFRSGLSVQPEVGVVLTDVPGSRGVSVGTVTFNVRQPLLRGRGRSVVAAGEMSAEREVAASSLDAEQTTAERILAVANQYWTARSALLNLDILRESEESSRTLLETTRKLIEADQTPAAELVQLQANLAAKESARIGGERSLFAARQGLGREIGLDPGEIAALPFPTDPFPAVRPGDVPPLGEAGRFVAAALRERPDLRAARERRAGLDILARAAGDALKPQLDLVLAPSYSGLEGGGGTSFLASLLRNVPGVSASAGFVLSLPVPNDTARGALIRAQAALRESDLDVDLLAKAVGAGVPSALEAVGSSALQLEKAREAVRLFEQTVVNEEKKLRAGTSTLIDVITQRDRLTAARQGEVSAELALAQALAQLRFETGTLLAAQGQTRSLAPDRLTTVPRPEEGTP